MASNLRTRPSRRILVLNKKLNKFIPIEEDMELQKLEEEKQRLAKEKALSPSTPKKVPGP